MMNRILSICAPVRFSGSIQRKDGVTLLASNVAGSLSAPILFSCVCIARITMLLVFHGIYHLTTYNRSIFMRRYYYTQLCLFYSYRVELAIADDTDEGIFVCYDGTMAKLHGLEAYEAGLITVSLDIFMLCLYNMEITNILIINLIG